MDEATKFLLIGPGALVLGVLAWVLPYRWNPFRFKRFIADSLPEKVNHAVPKVIGSILILIGLILTGLWVSGMLAGN